MGHNYPPMDPRERRNAPWNQNQVVEVACVQCEWYGDRDDLDHGFACPSCGNEELEKI